MKLARAHANFEALVCGHTGVQWALDRRPCTCRYMARRHLRLLYVLLNTGRAIALLSIEVIILQCLLGAIQK